VYVVLPVDSLLVSEPVPEQESVSVQEAVLAPVAVMELAMDHHKQQIVAPEQVGLPLQTTRISS
jgi:hypothetical protein